VRLDREDVWWWNLEDDGVFTVSSTYDRLEGLLFPTEVLCDTKLMVFSLLWKSPAPSKVVVFSWKLLLDRIPTKVNLARRRILPEEASNRCVFCDQAGETSSHLFLYCVWTFHVWSLVCGWLEINSITPQTLFQHFECWNGVIGRKRLRKGFWLVWHASLWVIWKARNDRIFNNLIKEPSEIAEEIKVLSWRWFLSRVKSPPCLFYEWCWNPNDCLMRKLGQF